jgi:hypothetical protein
MQDNTLIIIGIETRKPIIEITEMNMSKPIRMLNANNRR